jgi:GntR family transcriptional regulator
VLHTAEPADAGGPRWRRVMTGLSHWLADGPRPPGQRLPTESELAERFGVHRLTVRQALAELARAGAIRTVHGRGSYVAEPPHRFRALPDTPSLVAQMREQGRTVTQELVGHAVVERSATPDAGDLPEGTLLRLDTVLAVDGVPWSRNSSWLPHDRFRGIPAVWTPQTSLTGLLQAAYGLRLRRAWRRCSAEPAGPRDAHLLDVPLGAPLLVLAGSNTDGTGAAVTLTRRRTRGDRMEYAVDLDVII